MLRNLTLLIIALFVSIQSYAITAGDNSNKISPGDYYLKQIIQHVISNNNEYTKNINALITKTKGESTSEAVVSKMETAQIKKEENTQSDEQVRLQAEAQAIENKKVSSRYSVDRYSDLSNDHSYITVEDMNAIIEHFDPSSPFVGHGDIFIEASEASGLDPIYILAHAAWESAWGTSYLAVTKGNYFGINAIDANPGAAHHMGSTMYEGVVNGAIWISNNYYANGQTSLDSMIYGPKMYATAADSWINGVNGIMSESYSYLRSHRGM